MAATGGRDGGRDGGRENERWGSDGVDLNVAPATAFDHTANTLVPRMVTGVDADTEMDETGRVSIAARPSDGDGDGGGGARGYGGTAGSGGQYNRDADLYEGGGDGLTEEWDLGTYRLNIYIIFSVAKYLH